MEVKVIDTDAEDMLYASIVNDQFDYEKNQTKAELINYLQCRFFHVGLRPSIEEIKSIIGASGLNNDLALYVCNDGDYIIKSYDTSGVVNDILKKKVTEQYKEQILQFLELSEFFMEYNNPETWTKLKAECFKKLRKQTKKTKELERHFNDGRLIDTLQKTIQITYMQRAFRTKPHILIVEDQIFSQKMLTSILKDYTCHVAESSAEALLLYMEKCPDIVLLDIELPDLSGHLFAKFINQIDKNPYVVMVSSNQYESDINMAKENQVKAFIAKPYKKESILNVIEHYMKNRKKKSS